MEGYGKVQGITSPQAKGWILQQLGSLMETATVEGAQFNSALHQSLELLSRSLSGLEAETVVTLLHAQGAVGLRDQPVAAD